ncbi:TPA: site-specific DNA-methyltransferase [Streptococcus suis]|nr:site-specific DNA-methyltransferase [Streptococcus suis]
MSTAQQKLGEYTQVEKLDLTSKDILSDNIAKIGQLFPEVLTESSDENGRLRPAIDFDKLRQFLSREIVEGRESYEFTWVGKRGAIAEAGKPTTQTLRPDLEESVDFDKSENVFITGDNLEVLKVLQESYLGKIDMIYIDPPYNTGKDFVYSDKFQMSEEELADEMDLRDEDGLQRVGLTKNEKSSARYHSDWLNMMYPRLVLARNLLKDSGVIFISIDDNEQANLKAICDEIFGEENFVAEIVRNTNSSKNQSLFVSISHEYCLIYSKNNSVLTEKHSENKWSVKKNNIDEYKRRVQQLRDKGLNTDEITSELKELTKYPRFIDFTNYWYFDDKGLYRKGDLGGVKNGNNSPLYNPLTGKFDPVPPGGYRYKEEKLKNLVLKNRIHFHLDGSLPTIKRYLEENSEQRPKSIMSDDQRPDYRLLKEFGLDFDNPKQLTFMYRILSIFEKDALFFDFFAGSATTAHAVMQLNAEDGGNRKYILCTLDEQVADKSAAKEAGYETIDQISRERIRRAAKKIQEEHPETVGKQDFGFRAYKLDSSNFKDVSQTPDSFSQESLFDSVSNIKDGRTDLDLLFQIMLTWGMELSLPIAKTQIDGTAVYNVADGALIACFADEISESVLRQIAKEEPLRAVFKDESFANSAAKINLGQIFKEEAPNTKVKVV